MLTFRQVSNFASVARAGPALVEAIRANGFDPAQYVDDHPDLAAAKVDASAACRHFLRHGYREPRTVTIDWPRFDRDRVLSIRGASRAYLRDLARSLVLGGLRRLNQSDSMLDGPDFDVLTAMAGPGLAPLIIAGDSHSYFYTQTPETPSGSVAPLRLLCTAGSAMGLSNPQSRTQYGARLLRWMNDAAPVLRARRFPVFLKFGQVDAEFVFNFRRIRHQNLPFSLADFEDFARRSVAAYFQFIDELCRSIDPRQVRVCSIFPPSLSDAAWADGYVNAHAASFEGEGDIDALAASVRLLDIPSLRVRTDLHAIYNAELQRQSARRSLLFIDDFAPLIGPCGTVDAAFVRGHGGDDHHLSSDAVGAVVARQLERFAIG